MSLTVVGATLLLSVGLVLGEVTPDGGVAAGEMEALPAPEAVSAPARPSWADVVVLKSGDELTGQIIADDAATLVFGHAYGTLRIPRQDVASVRRGDPAAKPKAQPAQVRTERLPGFSQVLETVAKRPWAKELHQVPATVIDTGILRHVPYISHRAGPFEINVYGDPDKPSGMEVGIYGGSAADQRDIQQLMAELMTQKEEQELVRALSLEQDNRERGGLTFEVTPATAADAFGGWWISIYDVSVLEKSRASDRELTVITETVPVVVEVEANDVDVDNDDDDDDGHYKVKKPKSSVFAKKPSVSKVVPASAAVASSLSKSSSYSQWNKSDFAASSRYSKPKAKPSSIKPSGSSKTGSSSSRVYVRSFQKSSGSYTRSSFFGSKSSSSKSSSSKSGSRRR